MFSKNFFFRVVRLQLLGTRVIQKFLRLFRKRWFRKMILLRLQTLTLSHTITTFNDPAEGPYGRHCGEKRKRWIQAFSPFPTMLSTIPWTNLKFSVTIILSSANALNLDQSKILSFGTELNSYKTITSITDICLIFSLQVNPGFDRNNENHHRSKFDP